MKFLPITISALAGTTYASDNNQHRDLPGRLYPYDNQIECLKMTTGDFGPPSESRMIFVIDESNFARNAYGKYDYIESTYKQINGFPSSCIEGWNFDTLTVIRASEGRILVENFEVENYEKNFKGFNYLEETIYGPLHLGHRVGR